MTRIGPAAKRLYPASLAHLSSSEPRVRYAAVGLVGTLDSAEAAKQVPALAKLAADPEPLIRRRVGSVLEKLGSTAAPAADAIGIALKTEKEEAVREQFVDALLAMGPSAKAAVLGLASMIGDANASLQLRLKVVNALIQADPASKDTADALVAASKDRDALVRKAAAGAIGKLNPLPDEARAALVKLMKSDSNGAVQLAAVRGLAVAGPRAAGAKSDLEAMTNSKLPATAFWAKVALIGANGDLTKAAGVVRDGLKDRNGLVRAAAADALSLVGPAAGDVPQLIRISRESAASEAAAHALGLIGPPAKEAVPRLIELVGTPDTGTRIEATEALGRIGLPSAAPAVPKIRDAMRADPAFALTGRKVLEKLGATGGPLN
ncbi:MAG: HEAT repeat domain-containing protein [Gemmataceae bacterium]